MSDETRDTENFDEKEMQNEAVAVETDGRDDGNGRGKPKTFFRKKVCRFCANKAKIDYGSKQALALLENILKTIKSQNVSMALSPIPRGGREMIRSKL